MRIIHWFRNDLRLRDNTALAEAGRRADELLPVFVLDPRIIGGGHRSAPRLRFLLDALQRLDDDLRARGNRLVIRRGEPSTLIGRLLDDMRPDAISFNRDDSPYARRRDREVRAAVEKRGVAVLEHKDRVVFTSDEVRTRDGRPFQVFTPYRNAWMERYRRDDGAPVSSFRMPGPPPGVRDERFPTAAELGVDGDVTRIPTAGEEAARRRLERFCESTVLHYARDRDFPAIDGTSRLSPYLRLGCISVRTCLHALREAVRDDRARATGAGKWREELIWREFYAAILAEHPRVLGEAFRTEYRDVHWNDDDRLFRAWCDGRTGYPFVDAAMCQLRHTGWMHNRARMTVASFLVKDLLIDWRRGERYFMQRLVDGDPASNNGGWQWAASTGTDAQPYFRIFNPIRQGERFDPAGTYVRRWVPALRDVPQRFIQHPWDAPSSPSDYPPPCVDHGERRVMAIARFEQARAKRRA